MKTHNWEIMFEDSTVSHQGGELSVGAFKQSIYNPFYL